LAAFLTSAEPFLFGAGFSSSDSSYCSIFLGTAFFLVGCGFYYSDYYYSLSCTFLAGFFASVLIASFDAFLVFGFYYYSDYYFATTFTAFFAATSLEPFLTGFGFYSEDYYSLSDSGLTTFFA